MQLAHLRSKITPRPPYTYLFPWTPRDLDDHVGSSLAVQLNAEVLAGVSLQVISGIVPRKRKPSSQAPRIEPAVGRVSRSVQSVVDRGFNGSNPWSAQETLVEAFAGADL